MTPTTTIPNSEPSVSDASTQSANCPLPAANSSPSWHVIWTRSQCEQMVSDQLAAKGFHVYLPMLESWTRIGAMRHRVRKPMFPGYLFLNHTIDQKSYISVCEARGMVRLLGEGWNRPAVVPVHEIEAIRRLESSRANILPYPYLREGQRVRITQGLLANIEGVFLRGKPNKGLFVVSIDLLQQSVAVEIDANLVEAI